ncbi:hypothetical protein [Sporomusa sphaeroides]|uniref:DUF4830 domain-containing protein n=1 Tax=Sporomusa sphaeroides DSM 2875 TaxID=1337886 RepID=A0ABM9W9J6_9FIRM|nr:hypothetical protein [Sporomusa sphaeroides]OLS54851.1 hypothetical protein SPSPH_41840 [Sporomusa sphaeroides DSM 2875]CVK21831.1 hypothetical protein SSPH_04549 [Sporomusa sphaeroides DSM 2875]
MRKWIIIIMGFFVVFVVGGYLLLNNEEGKRREIEIVQEYQDIKHPEGARMLHYELNRKILIRWIHSRYSYSINDSEVAKYYENQLLSKGWHQISYSLPPGKVGYLYAKDNLELALTLNKNGYWIISMHYSDVDY